MYALWIEYDKMIKVYDETWISNSQIWFGCSPHFKNQLLILNDFYNLECPNCDVELNITTIRFEANQVSCTRCYKKVI